MCAFSLVLLQQSTQGDEWSRFYLMKGSSQRLVFSVPPYSTPYEAVEEIVATVEEILECCPSRPGRRCNACRTRTLVGSISAVTVQTLIPGDRLLWLLRDTVVLVNPEVNKLVQCRPYEYDPALSSVVSSSTGLPGLLCPACGGCCSFFLFQGRTRS